MFHTGISSSLYIYWVTKSNLSGKEFVVYVFMHVHQVFSFLLAYGTILTTATAAPPRISGGVTVVK